MRQQLTENLNKIIAGIVNVEKNDINNENANMSSMTPAGQMMRFASEVSKIYALENLVLKNIKLHIIKVRYIFTIWTIIQARLLHASSMTWQTCLKRDSIQSTDL